MAILQSEKVVRQWGMIIAGGADREKWLFDQMATRLKHASPPAVVIKREAVTSGALFGEKRDFLIITHSALKEYALFINAQNFGRDLAVSWYLTVNPGFFKRALSKKIHHDPNALSQSLPVFAQQDLSSLLSSVHNRLQEVVNELMEELSQDSSRVDWSPKGFLNLW